MPRAFGSSRSVGEPRVYAESHMFGAASIFSAANLSTYLRHKQPQVIPLEERVPALIDLDLGPISGPESLGLPARAREMGIFNPSLVQSPPGLCSRCAYIAAVRVDPLHQCHANSPLVKPDPGMPKGTAANAWFKGTAIAALDKDLRVLGWTWLLNAPQHQVSGMKSPSRWFVSVGSSDRFLPPWAKAVYDVRLASIAGRLFVSYVCRKCAFSVAQLQVTATPTADGGLREMRAWQSRRYTSNAAWAQGRNQALFVAARSKGGSDELMVQPWMSLVASFGAPTFSSMTATTTCRKGSTRLCGATPPGTQLKLSRVENEERGGFGEGLELLGNSSHPALSKAAVGGFRLSTTSNLVRVVRPGGCTVYLGAGHVHRSEGELNKRMFKATNDCESIQFVSGLALASDAASPTLLASYGVNDCEAKVAKLSLERVWSTLEPLPGRALC